MQRWVTPAETSTKHSTHSRNRTCESQKKSIQSLVKQKRALRHAFYESSRSIPEYARTVSASALDGVFKFPSPPSPPCIPHPHDYIFDQGSSGRASPPLPSGGSSARIWPVSSAGPLAGLYASLYGGWYCGCGGDPWPLCE